MIRRPSVSSAPKWRSSFTIRDIFLSHSPDEWLPAEIALRQRNRQLILDADLICYPPGSFYTSILANFLPTGVGSAIAANGCPKVYIPNLGQDPEQLGMDMDQAVRTLVRRLRADVPAATPIEQLLNVVMLDAKADAYRSGLSEQLREEFGVQVIDTRLVGKRNARRYDGERLVSALLSLT